MADYSNLFRGGGISGVPARRPTGGKSRIAVFVLLCCIILLGIWGYSRFVQNPDSKSPSSDFEGAESQQGIILPKDDRKPDRPAAPAPQQHSLHANIISQAKENIAAALQALRNDEFIAARDGAEKVLNSQLEEGDPIWEQAADILGKANTAIYTSDMPAPNKKLYTIQEGDNLIKIAKRFKTTVESIQKTNSLDITDPIIFPGKTLYIYTGQWSVVVKKSKFRLYLYDDGSLFKIYSVGIGRQGRTPSGKFLISNKQKEPVWYNEGRAIPYGSKENVLGTRWMALQPVGDTDPNLRGYGIHGTWEPDTIGAQASNGCIRLTNDDVNELYYMLPYNTEVEILD
ncbi:MAG: L,D-transpeptidase family protein [Victivallales bacterium]|nr:L,D-transpeptidase family protein [Victivallales bacterium]